jgi:hypothetical protein
MRECMLEDVVCAITEILNLLQSGCIGKLTRMITFDNIGEGTSKKSSP